ncbi:MAG: double zinc ribbon domain-containing protein [Actinomycetota bacterium]
MWGRALDVVFPRACAGCGSGPWPFCPVCVRALRPLAPPWCERCGSPSILPVPSCADCPPASLTSARAAFAYDGPAKRAVHRLKFSGWRDVAAAMADAMAAVDPPAAADVVTWVPLARGRRAERGYDQARALAVALAHRLDLPAVHLLRRPAATDPQARRSGAERRTAMRGAFRAVRPPPARVLLVDDVLTTGATMAAAAEVLRSGGASQVHALAAARSLPGRALLRPSRPSAYPRAGSGPGLWLPGDVPR